MITVPKKNIRHAVGRVLLRRRIREAYRLNRSFIDSSISENGKHVDIAFIYMAKEATTYNRIESKMQKLLSSVSDSIITHDNEKCD